MKRLIFNGCGFAVSVIPPIVAIFSYFPVWFERGAATALSGISLLLLLIAIIPLIRIIRELFKSPSAPLIWLCLFILFAMLGRIVDEITVVAFVGSVSNLIGAILFKLGGGKKNEE